jgi:hypothetical protein
MSKAHRGKGLRELPARGRGVCGVCGRDRIKAIYEVEVDGQKKMVCKYCKATLKNKKA